MSFQNPVVGGGNQLIREEIKSPDYVAGVSGWCIRKDGSAEFNDVAVRGTVDVAGSTPGAYVKIEAVGTGAGILLRPPNNGESDIDKSAGIVEASNAPFSGGRYGVELNIVSPGYDSTFGDVAWISLVSQSQPGDVPVVPPSILMGNAAGSTDCDIEMFGNLEVGGSFKRVGCIGDLGTPSIPTGVGTSVTVSAPSGGDPYGLISGGGISIPYAGLWDVGVTLKYAGQAVSAGVRQVSVRVNGVEVWYWREAAGTTDWNNIQVAVGGAYPMVLAAGDVVTFQTFHNAGASLSLISGSRVWARM